MKILLLNGPNLASLGRREPEIYGTRTLAELEAMVRERGRALECEVVCFQSNHEGALIDRLEADGPHVDSVVINPGALAHTSYALYDALRGFGKPVVEVHISNVFAREEFRQKSVTAAAAVEVISGLGLEGYLQALEHLVKIHRTNG